MADPVPPPVIVTEPPAPAVVRSPTDVLRAVTASAVLVALVTLGLLFGDSIQSFLAELLRGVDAVGIDVLTAVVVATRLFVVVVALAGVGAALVTRSWRLLATVVGAGVVGGAVAAVATNVIDTTQPPLVDPSLEIGLISHEQFPTLVGVGAAAAMLTAAAPWLPRRWRRVGWVLVFALSLSRFLTSPVSFDVAIALAAGWLAGAVVLVAAGGPNRRPNGQAVADALVAAGVPLAELAPASVDARGSTPYFGRAADGRRVFAKALAQDERSADLLFRLYRSIVPRDLGDERPFSSLRRMVEHEALVSLMAHSHGITTPKVLAFAAAPPGGYVLSYEGIEGSSLDGVEAEELTDEVLDQIWGEIETLRYHRIAHRDLRLANVFLGADGRIALIDFGFSELAASDLLLRTDIAELLASLSLSVGADRALAAAVRALGPGSVSDAADRLVPGSLSGATRTAYKERPGELAALQAACLALSGP
ncbi:MAG: phosphotransferase [Acidimicrobiales bacterium]|nr:phosphotransferase [Acidimicrobiales bacterium]